MLLVRGSITEYTIPTANSGPQGIVAGPDNAMWFTEQTTNKIEQEICRYRRSSLPPVEAVRA